MAEQPDEIDYFASEQQPSDVAQQSGTATPPAASAVEGPREPLGPSKSPKKGATAGLPKAYWGVGGVLFAGFAVWIFWPSATVPAHHYAPQAVAVHPSTSHPQETLAEATAFAPTPTDGTPAAAAGTVAPGRDSFVASSSTASTTAATAHVAPRTASSDASPAAAASVMTAAQGAALSQHVDSLQQQLQSLSQKLDAVQVQISTDKHGATPPRLAASSSISRTSVASHSAGTQTKRSVHDDRVLSPDGQPYVIDTASRDVAWIRAGEHIEIVQPGARIGQVRVLAIDPVNRRVITSDGIIR